MVSAPLPVSLPAIPPLSRSLRFSPRNSAKSFPSTRLRKLAHTWFRTFRYLSFSTRSAHLKAKTPRGGMPSAQGTKSLSPLFSITPSHSFSLFAGPEPRRVSLKPISPARPEFSRGRHKNTYCSSYENATQPATQEWNRFAKKNRSGGRSGPSVK